MQRCRARGGPVFESRERTNLPYEFRIKETICRLASQWRVWNPPPPWPVGDCEPNKSSRLIIYKDPASNSQISRITTSTPVECTHCEIVPDIFTRLTLATRVKEISVNINGKRIEVLLYLQVLRDGFRNFRIQMRTVEELTTIP